MDFIPHDKKNIAEMLDVIGVSDIEQLFQDIPKDIKLKELKIPSGLSEPDLIENIKETAEKNRVFSHSFMGAGCYYHYIPSLVDFIINRSEFYTSYTPYQAEASQGFLQAMYEYQTIIAKLTGMDVANASMYDGSTALAEAIIMATIITRKNNVLVINELHPEYKEVIRTYCWGQNIQINFSNLETYEGEITSELGAVIFQSPNFFGELENIPEIVKKVRTNNPKCLIIQVMTDPTCLGVLKSPGTNEIDIFVAEGQSFGISPSFGGPGLGIFTTKQKYLRKIPGRLVGKTKELHGDKEGFILTLQAREQHIRREKASSNICTNQALCALSALIYLLSLGEVGLREVAKQNIQKADHVKKRLADIPGYEILNTKPSYNEFLVKCPDVDLLRKECHKLNLLPPLPLSHYYPDKTNIALVCVTELNTKKSIDQFIEAALNASMKGR